MRVLVGVVEDSMTPRVSILMPVFNGEHLLEGALQSLLRQSFMDFEMIILDNLSTDSTPLICKRLAEQDLRINYVRDTQLRTTHEASNYLVGIARGEFCVYAGDDDHWEKDFLEVLVGLIEAEPTADIAIANCKSINLNGRYVGRPFLRKREILLMKLGPFFFWWSYLVRRNVVPVIFALFRTEVLRNSPPFETFDNTGADVDNLFVLNMAMNHKIVITARTLFGYRRKSRGSPPAHLYRPDTFGATPESDPPTTLNIWHFFRYYIDHQVRFTRVISVILRGSKFGKIQRSLLYARIFWSFLVNIFFKFPISRILDFLGKERNNRSLDDRIKSGRTISLEQQKNTTGYLWKTSNNEAPKVKK